MAPEQLAGEEVTVKSDIYSLGLVLYEIFTGKLPFESDTLAGLMRAQRESAPVSPSTLVRDLDPAVERVILRCLKHKPSHAAGSALAVAAALPGGDPLAAALAAGETPSPEMVAAAGEGEGLSLEDRDSAAACGVDRHSGHRRGRPAGEHPREGCGPTRARSHGHHKSRDMVRTLGVTNAPADEDWDWGWDGPCLDHARKAHQPHPDWDAILSGKPAVLHFQYRRSDSTMAAQMYHDDLLTPGVVTWDDPPPPRPA